MGRLVTAALAGNPAGGATPPPTPPSGHPGVEFAELITGFTAQAGVGPTGTPNGINIDINAMGGPTFNYTLGWTNPTGFQPWMRAPFGGIALYVSFYGMSPLPNGPVPPSHAGYPIAAVTSGAGQNLWPFEQVFASSSVPNSLNQLGQGGTQLEDGESYDLIIWAVSMDADGNQNSFNAAVTPRLEITWTWPLGSAPTAAKYTDNVTSFALGSASYVANGAGQKVLRIPYSCTLPTDARFGGFTITYSKGISGTISVAVPVTLAASGNIDLPVPQASDLTGGNVPWYFYAVAQDTNGNLNSSLTIAPVSGTPFATITPSGPTGGSGVEFTSVVTGVSVSASTLTDSNGNTFVAVAASFTAPSVTTFGGAQLRLFSDSGFTQKIDFQTGPTPGVSTAMGIIDSPLAPPTTSTNWFYQILSYDVNGNQNTYNGSVSPHGSFSVAASPGLDGAFIKALSIGTAVIAAAAITSAKIASATITGANIASATITSANIASLNAGLITAGTITASVGIAVTGSGIETDITQVLDSVLGTFSGLRVFATAAPTQRICIGAQLIGFVNSSGFNVGELGFLSNALYLQLNNSSGNFRAVAGTDGSDKGYFEMRDGPAGVNWFAPWTPSNGTKIVSGNGTVSAASFNIVTGLNTITGFSSILSGPPADYLYTTSSSGGTITVARATGSASFIAYSWIAMGT